MKTRLALCTTLLFSGLAEAGRPISVDNADIDAKGTGHVEAWYARQPGRLNTWTVAPAYSPFETLELGGAVMRDTTTPLTVQSLQARWRITPTQESGCNFLATLGASRTPGAGNTPYFNGVATCNSSLGATHINIGANRPPGGPTLETWGIAQAHTFGAVTAHVEMFGQRLSKPTFQVGASGDIAKNVQLDGTVGRSNRQTVFSLGMKYSF